MAGGARRDFPPEGVRSVGRAFAVLDLLVQAAPHPVRVRDVAARVEADPATVSRLLATMTGRGYASRTVDRRFTVGPRSLPLATRWLETLRSELGPMLTRLRVATGEAVILVQLLGTTVTTVARSAPQQWPDALTGVAPGPAPPIPALLWAAASGRAILGTLRPEQRARLLPAEPYPRLTGQTVTTWEELRAAIRNGNREGVHVEEGEVHPRGRCLAVPLVREDLGYQLAVSVVLRDDLPARRFGLVHRMLRQTARDLNVVLPAG
jgi:IclR family transcriptional regulator, acetate operon repressor